ncbi:MAG: BC1881 family protein [Aerococcus urinaeequi]
MPNQMMGEIYMMDKVKIGYRTYDVQEVPVVDIHDTLKGNINFVDQVIKVSDFMTDDDKRETLIHEVLHGVEEFMGLDIPEEHIKQLGRGLAMVIADNPGIFNTKQHGATIEHVVINDDVVGQISNDIIDEIKKLTVEHERSRAIGSKKAVILPPEPAPPGFAALASKLSTKELVEELKLRKGVSTQTVEMDENRQFEAFGPCIMLCVTD